MTLIKFCGMSRPADVVRACELGVDAVGFVLWHKSPRYVLPQRLAPLVRLLPSQIIPVGVFVSPTAEEIARAVDAGIRVLQVHGTSSVWPLPEPAWIAASVESDLSSVPEHAVVVLDTHDPVRHGGTGRTIDWRRAADIARRRRVLLAGGLTPGNVTDAIRQVQPYGVDVASGIEDQPGIKNPDAMGAFVAAVRETHQ